MRTQIKSQIKMVTLIVLISVFIIPTANAQELWGIDVWDTERFYSWEYYDDDAGIRSYYKYNVGDFYAVSFIGGDCILFYRASPPSYMFDEVYNYLYVRFGEPDINKDYYEYENSEYDLGLGRAAEVILGFRKYHRIWDLDLVSLELIWKEEHFWVVCRYKE